MRYKLCIIILAAIIASLQWGCSKRALPSNDNIKGKQSFDSAAFDYIYIEAIRQKLFGNDGEALKYLGQCIRMNPGSDAAYFEIAKISANRGDSKNAKEFAKKSVEINERNIWYLTLLANIYYSEKNLDSSIIYYEKAVKLFPDQENLRLTIANLFTEKGDFAKAFESYQFFEEKYGINENTSIYYIKALIKDKRFGQAEEKAIALVNLFPDEMNFKNVLAEIYQAEGKTDNAVKMFQDLMEKNPDDPQTLLSLTNFLLSINEFDEMINLLNGLILNDKISKENKVGIFGQIIENDSIVKVKSQEIEVALRVLEANYKGDALIILLRPELYQKEKDIAMAISRLEDIVREMDGNYYAWEKLLILYSETGDYEKLYKYGKECATKFNLSYIAKVLYASAAMEKNELDVAAAELRKAEILAGDQKELLVQVYTMMADVLYRKKEYQNSFSQFEKALKLSPDDLILMNNYAYYLAEQGQDLERAEAMAKEVIQKEGNNGTYLDTFAWVLYKRGKVKEAIKVMDQIIKYGNKEDADWCEHYGFMMKSIKKCTLAKEYWNKAILLDSKKAGLTKEIENCTKN